MLVKELVEILSEYEQDAEVFLMLSLGTPDYPARGVELAVDSPDFGLSSIMELFLSVEVDKERHARKDAADEAFRKALEAGEFSS